MKQNQPYRSVVTVDGEKGKYTFKQAIPWDSTQKMSPTSSVKTIMYNIHTVYIYTRSHTI